MQEKRYSLLKIITALQGMVFCILLVCLLVGGIYIHQKRLEVFQTEKKALLQTELSDMDARLEVLKLQLQEIMVDVTGLAGLWSEDSGERYFAKSSAQRLLRDKQERYRDMELCFVMKPDEYFVSSHSAVLSTAEKLKVRDYLGTEYEKLVTNQRTNQWNIIHVGDKSFLIMVYEFVAEDIYTGLVVNTDTLLSNVNVLFDKNSAYELIAESGERVTMHTLAPDKVWLGNVILMDVSMLRTKLKFHSSFTWRLSDLFNAATLLTVATFAVLCLGAVLLQYCVLRRLVLRPVKEMAEAVADAEHHLGEIHIEEGASTEEVYQLQKTLNYLFGEVVKTQLDLMQRQVAEKDVELRQLRSQVRPHFYLNAIMTVSSMTWQNRNDDIREYLAELSTHMRYMLQIKTSMVRLGEELQHIQTYIRMQEIKFPGSVVNVINCPKELSDQLIPHLLLYTIVENAFKYAMDLSDSLLLLIDCKEVKEEGFCGYQVTIEDSGQGFTQKTLDLYNTEDIIEDQAGRHIGLSNVKRSLALQYNRQDLLQIANVVPHGARITIRIPDETENGTMNKGEK